MTPIERAQRDARRRWPRSVGFQDAYVAGVRAGLAGRPVDACPYLGGIRRRARTGWRPVWRSIWISGWEEGRRLKS